MKVRHVNVYGVAGLLGAVVFTSALVVLQAAHPEIDWTRHYVSDFANGRLGWVFVLGAAVHGPGNVALSLGLRRSLAPGPLTAGAVLLFSTAAVGITAAALFPTDPGGDARTLMGLVHRVAAAASFPIELIALILFSAAFAASPHWRRYTGPSIAISAIAAVTLVGLFLAVLWNRMPGLAERLALASFLLWEFGAALGLVRLSSSSAFRASRGDETPRARVPCMHSITAGHTKTSTHRRDIYVDRPFETK